MVTLWTNICSYPIEAGVEDVMAHPAKMGYRGFEPALAIDGVKSFPAKKWKCCETQVERLRLEILIVSVGLFWQIAELETALPVLEEFKVAKAAGMRAVFVLPNAAPLDSSPEGRLKRTADWLRKAASIAREHGIKIGLENVWNRIFPGPLDFLKLLDMVGDESVGVYFDAGNTLPHSLPEHWIPLLGKHILQVHVKDYCMAAGGLMRGFGIPYNGDVNWPAVWEALVGIGYEGYILPEVPPYSGDPYKAAEDALSSLRKIFNW